MPEPRPTRDDDAWSSIPPSARGPLPRLGVRFRRATLRVKLAVRGAGPLLRRAIDVVACGLGLLALAPLLTVVALLIKATSRGPVLFPQERIGQRGRAFKMWKLRSMYVGAEAAKAKLAAASSGAVDGVRFKLRRDPRITPVGRLIRKLSIDELPQLFNVLSGDMTLVGPRPPLRREVELYDVRASRRLEVRPGLTCLWQVGGRSDLSFDEQVALDLEYVDATKPLDEIRIVARTIPAVILGRGAY
jgi:lipopolysaccharide/colanic/teichoic acid biosynthesis glycosyltransferase